jgi:hypothetical protein
MDDFDLWAEELEPYEPPLLDRRRRTFRLVALVVVVAMILTLLIPVIVRITRGSPEPERDTVTVMPSGMGRSPVTVTPHPSNALLARLRRERNPRPPTPSTPS